MLYHCTGFLRAPLQTAALARHSYGAGGAAPLPVALLPLLLPLLPLVSPLPAAEKSLCTFGLSVWAGEVLAQKVLHCKWDTKHAESRELLRRSFTAKEQDKAGRAGQSRACAISGGSGKSVCSADQDRDLATALPISCAIVLGNARLCQKADYMSCIQSICLRCLRLTCTAMYPS